MNNDRATITINAEKEGSKYNINTQLSHANGLKVLVYVMELMDREATDLQISEEVDANTKPSES